MLQWFVSFSFLYLLQHCDIFLQNIEREEKKWFIPIIIIFKVYLMHKNNTTILLTTQVLHDPFGNYCCAEKVDAHYKV